MKLSNTQFLSKKNKGFTLIELLVVISIIATLGAISYGPMLKMINNANIVNSQKVCRDLVAAVDNFQLDYGYLPFTGNNIPTQDTQVTTDGSAFLDVIMGNNDDVNTRAISYFDADTAEGDKNGLVLDGNGNPQELLDKWGNHYHILLDYSGNGTIDGFNTLLSNPGVMDTDAYDLDRRTESAVALSPGKDGEFNDIGDAASF